MDPQSRTVPCRVVVDQPTVYSVNGQSVDPTRGSGLPALVRGMFVDVIIAAKPSRVLLLVPKLGVKPGNIIWKFEPNPEAIPPIPSAQDAQPTSDSASSTLATSASTAAASATASSPTFKRALKPRNGMRDTSRSYRRSMCYIRSRSALQRVKKRVIGYVKWKAGPFKRETRLSCHHSPLWWAMAPMVCEFARSKSHENGSSMVCP